MSEFQRDRLRDVGAHAMLDFAPRDRDFERACLADAVTVVDTLNRRFGRDAVVEAHRSTGERRRSDRK